MFNNYQDGLLVLRERLNVLDFSCHSLLLFPSYCRIGNYLDWP